MKKVSLKLRLVLAGAAFFALSGSANETSVTVTGTGRGVVSTVHRHGILFTSASYDEVQRGAQDMARGAAYADADEKCRALHGHLVDGSNDRNTTFMQAIPRPDEARGGPVYAMSARTTLRCAVPTPEKDLRVSNESGVAKARLITEADGSVWSVSTEGRRFQVLSSEEARNVEAAAAK